LVNDSPSSSLCLFVVNAVEVEYDEDEEEEEVEVVAE
jgi:hypothetical protein